MSSQTRRLMDDQAEEFSIDEHFRIVGYAEQLFRLVCCIAVSCFFFSLWSLSHGVFVHKGFSLILVGWQRFKPFVSSFGPQQVADTSLIRP